MIPCPAGPHFALLADRLGSRSRLCGFGQASLYSWSTWSQHVLYLGRIIVDRPQSSSFLDASGRAGNLTGKQDSPGRT